MVKRKKAEKDAKTKAKQIKKKRDKAADLAGITPGHLQTAKSIEDRSAGLLEDLHGVLAKHGMPNARVRSFALTDGLGDMPTAPELCRRWRCHTADDGSTVCGWEMEPCDS